MAHRTAQLHLSTSTTLLFHPFVLEGTPKSTIAPRPLQLRHCYTPSCREETTNSTICTSAPHITLTTLSYCCTRAHQTAQLHVHTQITLMLRQCCTRADLTTELHLRTLHYTNNIISLLHEGAPNSTIAPWPQQCRHCYTP